MYNVEAEQAIIGTILSDNDKIFKYPQLCSEHFFEETHEKIYMEMTDMITTGKLANQVTMCGRVNIDHELGATGYLATVAGMSAGLTSIDTYVELVIDKFQRRRIKESLETHLLKLDADEYIDTDVLIDSLHGDCLDIGADTGNIKIVGRQEVTKNIITNLDEDLPCFSTGIQTVDDLTGGGFFVKKNYCFAAPPKCGKTTLLQTMWNNMADAGIPVAYICAEMGQEEIHQRNISRAIELDSAHFLNQELRKSKKFTKRVLEFQRNEIKNGWYVDAPGISFEQLQRTVMTCVRRQKVKGIFLDYFQLVQGCMEKTETLVQFHEKLAMWIANICRKEKIFIVYAAQLNTDKTIRGGKAIEMNADMWLNMYFDDVDRGAWFKMMATRYLARMDAGSKAFPALRMEKNGPYFKDTGYEQQRLDGLL